MSGLFEDERMADFERCGLAGRASHAKCAVSPDDVIVVRRIGGAEHETARVAIGIREAPRASLSVVLDPSVARAFAAAILNAADEGDGATPLSFHPATADGVDPFGP